MGKGPVQIYRCKYTVYVYYARDRLESRTVSNEEGWVTNDDFVYLRHKDGGDVLGREIIGEVGAGLADAPSGAHSRPFELVSNASQFHHNLTVSRGAALCPKVNLRPDADSIEPIVRVRDILIC